MPDQETLIVVAVVIASIAFGVLVLGGLFSRLYRRASKERAFVRTGLGGQRVVMNGGALVWPVLHETIPVNMNTLRLEVERRNEDALITKDRMRVDVRSEFFVRVKPTEDAIADAAQTLGTRTQNPVALKELVEGKFVDALRAVAAEMTMEELHEQRVDFVQRVQTTVSEDILKNGLELESVSLTSLDQTSREFLNPQNAFDAQGLTKLTETIEAKRKQRNDIEQQTRIQIEQRNLEAEQMSLSISREQEYARLEQERELAIRRAAQAAEIAREQAEREQQAKQAQIAAQQEVNLAEITARQGVQTKQIETDRLLTEQEIDKTRKIESAEIDKLKAIELAEQDRAIAIAEKSKEKSISEAEAAKARAEAVRAEEQVVTAKEREAAERCKVIELVQAAEQAEREAIKITVAADAEKKAAIDRAAALRTIAEAEAAKIRIAAEGDAEAEKVRAEAAAIKYDVDATGQRAINEAQNTLDVKVIEAQIKKVLIETLPEIIRESVKPMERIDGIKIVQVEGLTGGNGHGASASASEGSLADQLVSSALRYRSQAPLIDSLMKEVGLAGGDLNAMGKALLEPANGVAPAPELPEEVKPG